MKEIQIFNNEEFGKMRTIIDGSNNVWFSLKDVCDALDISNTTDVKNRLNERYIDSIEVSTPIISQGIDTGKTKVVEMTFISEPNLYKCIFQSRKPNAESFQNWVCEEVLPSIRQTFNALDTITYKGCVDGIVTSVDGIATTTSEKIANVFHRQHKDVIEAIEAKLNHTSDKNQTNIDDRFAENYADVASFLKQHIRQGVYIDSYGRAQKNYVLDEYGFDFIVLGFTGRMADEYKVRYISAFHNMKNAIMNMFKAKVLEEVLPQNSRLRQYIYVVKNPFTEYIKIGVTQDVETRVRQLQTGAGVELELAYKSMVCSNAFEIESLAHKHFSNNKVFGEWFDVNTSDAIAFLEEQEFILKSEFKKSIGILY